MAGGGACTWFFFYLRTCVLACVLAGKSQIERKALFCFFFSNISCMFLFHTPPSGPTRLLCGTNKT